MRRPAFTLVELLVASVILVSVAIFATTTLVSSVRLQLAYKQNQNLVAGSQRALDEMARDISESISAINLSGAVVGNIQQTALRTLTLDDAFMPSPTAYKDNLIVVVVSQKDSLGVPTGFFEKHVYCAEESVLSNGRTSKRLVRYVLDQATDFSTNLWVSPNRTCTPASIASLFQLNGNPISTPVPQYLTEPSLEAASLHFTPVWLAAAPAQGAQTTNLDIDPPAVRIELVAQFDQGNGDPKFEARANSQTEAPPLVLRTLASRSDQFRTNR